MTTDQNRDELGQRAWRILAGEMQRQGAIAAFQDMLIRAPHALREMVDWLNGQSIDRRRALCDELFGSADEP
jgi:hypothetical protein